jgi:hypothetical protein
MSEPNADLAKLLVRYAAAFERADAEAMVDCYALPYLVVRDDANIPVLDAEQARADVAWLLDRYRSDGFARAPFFIRGLDTFSDVLRTVRVRWALQREDKSLLRDVECTYLIRGLGDEMRFVGVINPSGG